HRPIACRSPRETSMILTGALTDDLCQWTHSGRSESTQRALDLSLPGSRPAPCRRLTNSRPTRLYDVEAESTPPLGVVACTVRAGSNRVRQTRVLQLEQCE